MTHPRAHWTIQDYEDELERLDYLADDLDPATVAELRKLLENEIRQRFTSTDIELRGIELENDNESQ